MKRLMITSLIAALLLGGLSGCGLTQRLRDNYMGKDNSDTSAVPRDEYGNPILKKDSRKPPSDLARQAAGNRR